MPGVDLGYRSVVWLICTPSACEVLMPGSFPRWRQVLHNWVLCRWVLSDMADPTMPFGRHLSRAVIVLGKVYPSMPTRNLLCPVQILKVTVAEAVGANKTPRFGVADGLELVEPLFEAYAAHRPDCA